MNTRFKFFLINYLSRSRVSRNSGFALPMAIMVGLCIIVVGMAVVIQAQGNQSKVVSQQANAVANAAAEAGLTRVMNFIKQNPAVAAYNMESWSNATMMTAAVTQTTVPTSGGVDTVNTTNFCSLPSPSPAPSGSGSGTNTVSGIATQVTAMTVSSGQTLNASDTGSMSPRFKLEQYVYDGTSGTAKVRVSGIAGDSTNPKAKSNLVAKIPVMKTQQSVTVTSGVLLPAAFPALWIKSTATVGNKDKGLANVYSDALGPCTGTPVNVTNDDKIKPDSTNTFNYKRTSQQMPDAPATPAAAANLGSGSLGNSVTLPRSTDNTSSTNYVDGRYLYKVGSINWQSGSGQTLTFTPGQKVTLYVTGNIDFKNGSVKLNCPAPTANTDAAKTTAMNNCNATDAMIVGSSSNSSGSIEMTGNPAVCNVFIWAPTYDAYLGGGGNSDCPAPPNSNAKNSSNRGIFWVKTFNSNANNNSSHAAFSDQNSGLWSKMISSVNALSTATQDIPATSSTTATYTEIGMGQQTEWGRKDSAYVIP